MGDDSEFRVAFSDAERTAGRPEPTTLDRAYEKLRKNGGVVLDNVFDPHRLEPLREFFEARYRRYLVDHPRYDSLQAGHKRILKALQVEGLFNDPEVYANPVLMAFITRTLGERFIIGQFGSVTSMPGAEAMSPHRDSRWLFDDPEVDTHLPPYAVTVIVPLVGFNHARGTTRFWQSTHQVASDEEAPTHPPVDAEIPVGSVLCNDCRVFHGGTPNVSNERRPMLYFSYQRPWFIDHFGYEESNQKPLNITEKEFLRVPETHRHMFRWAVDEQSFLSPKYVARRLVGKYVPKQVKDVLRSFAQS